MLLFFRLWVTLRLGQFPLLPLYQIVDDAKIKSINLKKLLKIVLLVYSLTMKRALSFENKNSNNKNKQTKKNK